MPPAGPLLKVSNVSRRYAAPDSAGSITVLDDISFEMHAGQALAIVGPSGSGKSTLLQIIGTLDKPTSGKVYLEGLDLQSMNEAEIAAVRNRKVGFVFQAHYLLPQCTALENVLVPTLAGSGPQKDEGGREAPKEGAESRARRLLGRVGLAERLDHRPGQLSGGERQRVALVRALINQPRLLLADEPTGALDQESAKQLAQLLLDLNQEEKVTLIIVTHSRELAGRMQRVFELRGGRLQDSNPVGAQ